MPGHDIIVIAFSAVEVVAPACPPNTLRSSGELPAFRPVHEQPIELAAAEHR
jgi:hypothetical protein